MPCLICPENYKRVGAGASLTKSVLYSPVLLKRIAGYVQGKPAYIVPGVVGPEELTLAAKLGLPILGAEPSLYTAFASPAGAKRVFEAADVVTPVGTGDIHSEDELVSTLSKYLMQHPDVQRWIVKVGHSFLLQTGSEVCCWMTRGGAMRNRRHLESRNLAPQKCVKSCGGI